MWTLIRNADEKRIACFMADADTAKHIAGGIVNALRKAVRIYNKANEAEEVLPERKDFTLRLASKDDRASKTGRITDKPAQRRKTDKPKKERLYWNNPRIVKITRLQLFRKEGFNTFKVLYCYGVTTAGKSVMVDLPFKSVSRNNYKKDILSAAGKDGIYAKGLDIFNAIVVKEAEKDAAAQAN